MAYYSTKQVAEILQVKPQRLQAAVWNNRIAPPPKGPGDNYLWSIADIESAARTLSRTTQLTEWKKRGGRHESKKRSCCVHSSPGITNTIPILSESA